MIDDSKQLRVRMAPSPTGFLHVGGLRTSLYNFLLARKYKGVFVLRIEDTDQSRLVEGALENIVQTLTEFGLAPDEGFVWKEGKVVEVGTYGPYLQSKRLDLYKKYALELVEKKVGYYCFCTPERLEEVRKSREAQKLPPKYDKHCLKLNEDEIKGKIDSGEKHVIRLNVPADRTLKFMDLVHGEVSFSTNDIDDQVLLKSDGFPTYHLAVVVDDHLMDITLVIRGDEWISSTPKHLLIYEALGWDLPQFAHLPLLLSKTKKKLSKRDGDVAVKDFEAQGYLPEALINFVAFLGWNPKTEQEIFTLDELIKEFAVEKINKAGAVFDLEKLDWINGQYIRQLPLDELQKRIELYLIQARLPVENYPREFVIEILKIERERLKKLSEIGERVRYFFEDPLYDHELLVWKKSNREETKKNLQAVYSFLQNLPEDKFKKDFLETEIKKFIEEKKFTTGEILWPLRAALSGLSASPSPFEIMGVFGVLPNGKEVILRRISLAIEKL
ncbi:MAG: glutamate--tRNA ligase [Candidatus Doudnabacteria bacterium]|nr:glutamate--tRNA ligase [Candidatus Doudnabacteria bacterium]